MLASGRAHADAERWSDAYEAYTEATRVQPKYFLVWLERARLNAKLGRWTEAAADYAQALRIGCPVDKREFLGVPQLLFYAGETAAYGQLCEELGSVEDDPLAIAVRGRLFGEISQAAAADLADRLELKLSASRLGGSMRHDGENDDNREDARSSRAAMKSRRRYSAVFHGANL